MKEVTYDQYTWNDIALSILLERKQYLEDLIKNKTVSISEAPEGHLRAIDRGNYYQYFRRVDPKDSTGEYLTKKNVNWPDNLHRRIMTEMRSMKRKENWHSSPDMWSI